MKVSLKRLLYLPIIFLFLPAFDFALPGHKQVYAFIYPIIYFGIFLSFCFDIKGTYKNVINVIKNTPIKFFFLTIAIIILNSFLLSITNISSIFGTLRSIIFQIFLNILAINLFFYSSINKYISFINFIKTYMLLFWINLNIGFIAYIGQAFDITIINNIFDFLANERIIGNGYFSAIGNDLSNYIAFGFPRLDNLHVEPGFYARSLFLMLPMVYSFCDTKLIIFNKSFDKIIKKTLVPYTWLSLILTLSPIYLIFATILTLIYYYSKLKLLLKKRIKIISILFVSVVYLLITLDLSETYLSRIINIVINVHSFEDFIIIEPSLASRVVCYINLLCLWLKHPLIGVGLGNLPNELLMQIQSYSPVALTYENIGKIKYALFTNSAFSFNIGIIYEMLATNGICAFIPFCLFYQQLLKTIKKYATLYSNSSTFNEVISRGVYGSLWGLLIIMFYDSSILLLDFYIIVCIAITYIFAEKKGLIGNDKK